jgi:N-acetylglucosaminylphosphatidylinositol deacetylase
MPDSMQVKWPAGLVAQQVSKYLNSSQEKIDIIVTFDDFGVSYHPNHIGVFEGCAEVFKRN